MKDVLILGGGAGGAIVANKLARELRREIAKDQVRVTVLDKTERDAINRAGFTFVPFGFYGAQDLRHGMRQLLSPRINLNLGKDGEVRRVDLKAKSVTVQSGKKYPYDYLVIATGAVPDFDSVTGLSKDIHSFYSSLEDAARLGEIVQGFEGGRIVILTVSMPIACPGAPAKFAVLLDDYLRSIKGEEVRNKVDIKFLWPIPMIGPPAYNEVISKVLQERGVEKRSEFKFARVDENEKEVVSEGGERIKYDLLVTIPPHKCLKALVDSGITDEKGWVPADKQTLRYHSAGGEKHDEVFVLGDTGPAQVLKTGIGVHYQAPIVAENLISELQGQPATALYKGETGCPIVTSSYTGAKQGQAFLTTWTYDNPLGPFAVTKLGWFVYRAFYYVYWDATLKALI